MTDKEKNIKEAGEAVAYEKATDEERGYISRQRKNRSVWIVIGTLVVLAIAARWIYKH